MSLINDALKKAQRSRGSDAVDSTAPDVAGGRITKRAAPLSAKTMLLYASGALVLFVLAVVATVLVLNRPSSPSPTAEQARVSTPAIAGSESGAPLIVPPVILPAAAPKAPTSEPAATETVSQSTPIPAASGTNKASPAPSGTSTSQPGPVETPVAATPPSPPPTTPAANTPAAGTPPVAGTTPATPTPVAPSAPSPGLPDERIHVYLDGLHVTAVRLQPGSESRVMMNERVFRVNDVVDRGLSLRLTKVEAKQLTFTDANGITYVKYL